MSKKYNEIDHLENRFNWLRKKKQDVVYRITESPSWYNIWIEYDGDGEQVAYYQTGDWSEIVSFCETHCNPGYDYLLGLGCTDQELVEATERYIHSLGKKTRYE